MKRILLINAHTALLCLGTIINAVAFILCWPHLHGLFAGFFYIGAFVLEWILTLLTQRSGASWTKKRYNIAYICCYALLGVAMGVSLWSKPLFRGTPEGTICTPGIDSIVFTVVALFFCAAYSWAMGLVVRRRPDNYDEFKEFYYSQHFGSDQSFF